MYNIHTCVLILPYNNCSSEVTSCLRHVYRKIVTQCHQKPRLMFLNNKVDKLRGLNKKNMSVCCSKYSKKNNNGQKHCL